MEYREDIIAKNMTLEVAVELKLENTSSYEIYKMANKIVAILFCAVLLNLKGKIISVYCYDLTL